MNAKLQALIAAKTTELTAAYIMVLNRITGLVIDSGILTSREEVEELWNTAPDNLQWQGGSAIYEVAEWMIEAITTARQTVTNDSQDSNETLRQTIIAAVVAIMVAAKENEANISDDYAVGTYLYGSESTVAEQEYIAALDHESGFEHGLFMADIRREFDAAQRANEPIGLTLACSCGECADCSQPTKPEPYDCPVEINSTAAALDVQLYSGIRCDYTGNPKANCRCYYCNLQSQAAYSVHKTFFGER